MPSDVRVARSSACALASMFLLAAGAGTVQGSIASRAVRSPQERLVSLTDDGESFDVIELRRYEIEAEKREEFAPWWEKYFLEGFERLGIRILGQFFERGRPESFTFLRAFPDIDARKTLNEAVFAGPLWKEQRARMNDFLLDYTNVLLLRPLTPERRIPLLPAMDSREEDARGVAVALIFTIQPGRVDAFAAQAEPVFAGFRSAGAREAGLLATLDVPNNFPRLPIRTDGPFLVWLGVLPDDETLDARFRPLAKRALPSLTATGLLRNEPELVVLDPTPRSRLRWLPEWKD